MLAAGGNCVDVTQMGRLLRERNSVPEDVVALLRERAPALTNWRSCFKRLETSGHLCKQKIFLKNEHSDMLLPLSEQH